MLNNTFKLILAATLLLFLSACATSITIKTDPSGADVKIVNESYEQKDKVHSDVVYRVRNSDDLFANGKKSARVLFIAFKEGYKPTYLYSNIIKGQANDPPIIGLEVLNTEISFETTPPGAKIRFFKDEKSTYNLRGKEGLVEFLTNEYVPLSEESSERLKELFNVARTHGKKITAGKQTAKYITTPFSERFSEKTVKNDFDKTYFIRIEKENYLTSFKEISINPGESNVFSFQLQPFHTELKIVSDPDGAEVEDKRKGGFGYLGKTPLIKNFTYKESMSKAKSISGNRWGLKLLLKASMPGYEEEYKEVEANFGENKAVRIQMKRQATEITFQSDPPEAHVYVERYSTREVFDEETRDLEEKTLQHWKHLGTTPFTYYMDPSDPLSHDDKMKFSKPGYSDVLEDYKSGVYNYHRVLEPKGDISHEGIIK